MKTSKAKISDITPDDKNYNKGNEFGNSLIEKSLRKFGAGRSILLDKNNRIIGGNKTIENASSIGMEDVIIVETTGNEIVAVKRMDIDLDTKKGRELALADNATSKANITWDFDVIIDDWTSEESKEWGVVDWEENEDEKEDEGNNSDPKDETNMIVITLTDEEREEWLTVKEGLGIMKDKSAFFEILKIYSNETNID